MNGKAPSTKELRKKGGVIDQRQQQIDPAGRQRVDVNEAAKRSQKQPGRDPGKPDNEDTKDD